MIIEKGDIVETKRGKAIVIDVDQNSNTIVIDFGNYSMEALSSSEIETVHRGKKK